MNVDRLNRLRVLLDDIEQGELAQERSVELVQLALEHWQQECRDVDLTVVLKQQQLFTRDHAGNYRTRIVDHNVRVVGRLCGSFVKWEPHAIELRLFVLPEHGLEPEIELGLPEHG